MLGLNETKDQFAMANSVRWYGDVLRRGDGHVLRRALDFEVVGKRQEEWPKRTWKIKVEEEIVMVGLRREDVLCRSKWSVGISQMAAGLRRIWPLSLVGDTAILSALVSISQMAAGWLRRIWPLSLVGDTAILSSLVSIFLSLHLCY